jgi:hypothetical protein
MALRSEWAGTGPRRLVGAAIDLGLQLTCGYHRGEAALRHQRRSVNMAVLHWHLAMYAAYLHGYSYMVYRTNALAMLHVLIILQFLLLHSPCCILTPSGELSGCVMAP